MLAAGFFQKRDFRRDGQEFLGYSDIANFRRNRPDGQRSPNLIGAAYFRQQRTRKGGIDRGPVQADRPARGESSTASTPGWMRITSIPTRWRGSATSSPRTRRSAWIPLAHPCRMRCSRATQITNGISDLGYAGLRPRTGGKAPCRVAYRTTFSARPIHRRWSSMAMPRSMPVRQSDAERRSRLYGGRRAPPPIRSRGKPIGILACQLFDPRQNGRRQLPRPADRSDLGRPISTIITAGRGAARSSPPTRNCTAVRMLEWEAPDNGFLKSIKVGGRLARITSARSNYTAYAWPGNGLYSGTKGRSVSAPFTTVT